MDASYTNPPAIVEQVKSPWGKGLPAAIEPVLWDYFQNKVRQLAGSFDGTASIYFFDFKTERSLSVNEDESYYPACLIKFPFMVAAMQAVNEGKLSMTDMLEFKTADYAEGSGILKHDPIGSIYSVHHLLDTMIQYSDNIALNILIDAVGMDYANQCFTNFGLENTRLYHKVMYYGTLSKENLAGLGLSNTEPLWQDLVTNGYILPFGNLTENFFSLAGAGQMVLSPEFESIRGPLYQLIKGSYHAAGYNQMTAKDTALLFRKIYDGGIINADISKACLRLLEENTLNDRIPAGLPEGVMIAHKTGSTSHVCHDAGIVFTPKGDFIICILTRDSKGGYEDAREFIRNIAILAYNYQMETGIPPYQSR